MHPPVRVSPGHLPLEREQPIGVEIVACDALTGEPLVVRAPAHLGQVIHAVPHWWQETEPDATELGRRSVASIAAFADSDIANHDSTVGWFGSASAMLASLLTALDHALDEIDVPKYPDSFSPQIDLD
jgi:hypothetical protein